MSKLLYVTSSSYSGSTLLTFLMNKHPEIFTIGEMEGWDYGSEEYKCSCGEILDDCQFFLNMRDEFNRKKLPFKMNNFGTKLQLSTNKKINRYLTSAIPGVSSNRIEKSRDRVLWGLPVFNKRMQESISSNQLFISSSLSYSGASVFMDATKNPFRLRLLENIPQAELYVLYLVRDIRGVVASNVRKKGVSVEHAADAWLNEQDTIKRILQEYPGHIVIYYEELCNNTNKTLSEIYAHVELGPYEFDGSIRAGDHHILGNMMRVTDVNDIKLDERWRQELSKEQLESIDKKIESYLNGKHGPAREVVEHYHS